jgi:uncharacterized protein
LEDAIAAYDQKGYATALRLVRPLAEQGDPKAQGLLADMYWRGEGVQQDYVLAHMWLNLATAHGATNAAKSRDEPAAKMTPEQVADAQRLAREWKPTK